MSEITIVLPESLRRGIAVAASKDGYSLEQFLATAAAEKLSALMTADYLRQEAALGRREDFDMFLAAVPPRTPADSDLVD